MEIRLLGPVELSSAGQQVDLGNPRRRCVLAVLAMTPGQPVAVETLLDRVWGEHPPAAARNVLYSYVSRLRAALGRAYPAAGRTLLRRSAGGYLLDIDRDRVDLHRARRLAGQAATLAGTSRANDQQASTLLAEASELWRGAPLAGLSGPWAELARHGMVQERLAMLTDLYELELRLGRHSSAVGNLSDLLATNPTAEPLAGLLMRALYYSDRQAEALEVYSQVRERLIEQIGDEPGPTLRKLHEQVLRRDPVLDQQLNASPPAGPEPVPPAQLPGDLPAFVGRATYLRQLDATLQAGEGTRASIAVTVLVGAAGIGKTALAVHWAHCVRAHYPDGQLYLNLRGFDPHHSPVSAAEALARFLRAFGVERIPAGVDESISIYRSLLADRRMLVVLDNAADSDQVRPLLPSGPGSVALVTSRNQLNGLLVRDGAQQLRLGLLTADEACELLTRLVGHTRSQTEPAAVAELAELCGHLPLALRVAAASLTTHPQRPIAGWVTRLRDRDRLTALTLPGDPDSAVSTVFDLSYTRLPDAARRMFRLLGLVPGHEVSVEAAAALSGTGIGDTERQLESLAAANVVEECAPGRYTCHDLLRHYAADLVARTEPQPERVAALDRLYDYYVRTTDAAAHAAYPQVMRLAQTVVAEPAPTSAGFDGPASAWRWLDGERATLLAAIQRAPELGQRSRTWSIADNLRGYLWFRGHPADWAAVASASLAAAQADDHSLAQAASHLSMAALLLQQVRYREATDHGQSALTFAERTGWAEGQVSALSLLGMTHARAGDYRTGIEHLRRALALCEQSEWRHSEAAILATLGSMYGELGDLSLSTGHAQRALTIAEELDLPNTQAISLCNLGLSQLVAGHFARAQGTLNRALELYQAAGSIRGLGVVQAFLAEMHVAAGRYGEAAKLADSVIARARQYDHRVSEADAHIIRAAVYRRSGRPWQAIDACGEALRLSTHADNGMLANTVARTGLAAAHLQLGEHEWARQYVEQALVRSRAVGFRLAEAEATTLLAVVALAGGEFDEATAHGEQATALHRLIGHPLGEARTNLVLAHIRKRAGDHAAAGRYRDGARTSFAALGIPGTGEVADLRASLRE